MSVTARHFMFIVLHFICCRNDSRTIKVCPVTVFVIEEKRLDLDEGGLSL